MLHQKQGLHVCYPETTKDKTYLSESGELSSKDGYGDTSFQWSQFTTHLGPHTSMFPKVALNCYHDQEKYEHAGPKVTTSHEGKHFTTRMIKRFTMAV
ncbi:hypothetical protein Tco_0596394 [Tanacetum coccineum]